MHLLRIGPVEPLHICRDALAEVGFKAIHANIDQALELVGIPPAGFRVGKVVNRQPRLPFVPLPQ